MGKFCSKCFESFDDSIMTSISGETSVCPNCLVKIQKSTPREYTTDETQEKLIKTLWGILEYWYNESETPDTRGKMTGLLFTILSTLDGSGELPGFKIIPNTHPDDKDFHIKFGENWYNDKIDIGGSLHELMNHYGPTKEEEAKIVLNFNRERKLKRITKE